MIGISIYSCLCSWWKKLAFLPYFIVKKEFSVLLYFFKDCVENPEWCTTCPGGAAFTNGNMCPEFSCTDDSHCRNGGTCNGGQCQCPLGCTGIDCGIAGKMLLY